MSIHRFHTFRDAVLCDLDVATRMLAEDPKLVLLRNSIGETAMHFLAIENHRCSRRLVDRAWR